MISLPDWLNKYQIVLDMFKNLTTKEKNSEMRYFFEERRRFYPEERKVLKQIIAHLLKETRILRNQQCIKGAYYKYSVILKLIEEYEKIYGLKRTKELVKKEMMEVEYILKRHH